MSTDELQPFDHTEPAIRKLFEGFREGTYIFKERSGLDWEHLLPGLQAASVVHFIRDRGKERTVDFLQKLIRNVEPSLQEITPKARPSTFITALHVENMAIFNKVILQMADDYVAKVECPPGWTAHALSMLVIAITVRHFDLIMTASMFAAAIEQIGEGKFDRYQQDVI